VFGSAGLSHLKPAKYPPHGEPLVAPRQAALGRGNFAPNARHCFEEDDRPSIEASPRAALVVAFLRRIAYTRLALFRSVTQRSDERRATPWQTLMADLFVALITTTDHDLREPKPLRLR